MNGSDTLIDRVRLLLSAPPPVPGRGHTAERHRYLIRLGREDLSLARLAEAHWDAVAILAEAGREPDPGLVYGVWAAEIPGKSLTLTDESGTLRLHGVKPFCSGAGLVDRALMTVASPEARLLEVDLQESRNEVTFDHSAWHSQAFEDTRTATATFRDVVLPKSSVVGPVDFYLSRPGFWHGACGPAACWAGGAIGLVDWALGQKRDDAHTRAHLGAMKAAAWGMEALLQTAGDDIDRTPEDATAAHVRALIVRHLVEQHATDILQRFGRVSGPGPLVFEPEVSRRYQELELYLRQSHAERDLEALRLALYSVGQRT